MDMPKGGAMTRPVNNNGATEVCSPFAPVHEGDTYPTGYHYLDDNPTLRGRLAVRYYDASFQETGNAYWGPYTTDGTDWQSLQHDISIPSGSGIAYIRICSRTYTQSNPYSGYWYLDKLFIIK